MRTPRHTDDRGTEERAGADRGATLVEYAFLVALVALVAIGAMSWVGNAVDAKFTEVAGQLGGDPSSSTTAPEATTTTTTAAPTTPTTRPRGVPKDWPADKPIPPVPDNCRRPKLEDNGVWNCQH